MFPINFFGTRNAFDTSFMLYHYFVFLNGITQSRTKSNDKEYHFFINSLEGSSTLMGEMLSSSTHGMEIFSSIEKIRDGRFLYFL